MQTTTIIAVYFSIRWLAMLEVLPFGVRSPHEDNDFPEGTDPGAPIAARIGRKLIWTTIVATIVFVILSGIYKYGLIDFDGFMRWLRPSRY